MNIVVLDGYTLNPGDNPWTGLEPLGTVTIYDRTADEQIVPRSREAEVLIINKVRLSAERLNQLPRLKFIAVTATGFDCVDIQAARARGIEVSNVPVYGTDSVAQHVLALLLHICHRIDLHHQAVQQGEWQRAGDFSFWKVPLVELAGKRMGIIGMGRIGQRVGELAHALGMHVLAVSRRQTYGAPYDAFTWCTLEQLLAESDVISLHCPLTEETRGLINQASLARCKASAILLNASRGPLVVEADLADALNAGRLAAAGLDVVSSEPITSDNPLLTAKNCFITPHQAWATREARGRLMQTTVENVAAFVRGEPQNIVN